ncbi:PEP/pyruvate-binding domain-containing protein [Micromonospora sp. NPDC049282]|uniref:PEP/pyruvate-binding domain-containing protein n=1 Tax=Micromonospora sp. NPDC049282 TaxID=3364269 RepID=UPI0037239B9E
MHHVRRRLPAGARAIHHPASREVTEAVWIVQDTDYHRTPAAEIGGKARGLGTLLSRGAPCPPSFCLTTAALRHAVTAGAPAGDETRRPPALVADLRIPTDLTAAIRAHAESLPAGTDGRRRLAVRSSFVTEDTPSAVSPGIYRSETGVSSAEELESAILRVWASAFTAEAMAYRETNGLPVDELGMAVIIQQAVTPRAGGVAYTIIPGTSDATNVLIEYAEGSPANVVENRVEVMTCLVDKRTRSVPPLPAGPFSPGHALDLVAWATRLERSVDAPLDLEWLIDEGDDLWLLQARPLPYSAGSVSTGPLVGEARATTLRSAKLVPFRLAGRAAITVVPASLILPAAFEAFKRSGGRLTSELVEAMHSVFDRFLPHGPVSMRSAYWSALGSGDLMPVSGPFIDVDSGLAHVTAFWRHIIEHARDDYTAEVALLVCNWTDLRASVIATAPGPTDQPIATVSALYGQLDGLETCAHDVYEIDLDDLTLHRSTIPAKPHAVRAPGQLPEEVPPQLRTVPVLDAEELDAVGRNLSSIRQVFGAARVEQLVLNGCGPVDERVVTWQVSGLSPAEAALRYYTVRPSTQPVPGAVATGVFVTVRRPDDIRALLDRPADQLPYIDFTGAAFRDPAAANAMGLDLKRAGCPVLLKGSLLSHFAALLRDYAVTVYPVLESLDDIPPSTPVAVTPWPEADARRQRRRSAQARSSGRDLAHQPEAEGRVSQLGIVPAAEARPGE